MANINSKTFAEISADMIARYSRRYKEMGYNVRTLGWGSTEQQLYRFEQAINGIRNLQSASVLDIGCGFGDLLKYMLATGNQPAAYTGFDINPDLVNESRLLWKDEKSIPINFEVNNIAEKKRLTDHADIVIMLGVLNLNFHEQADNYEYSFQLIRNAFAYAKDLLIVDFLSNRIVNTYAKEDFVFYYDPLLMLEFALTLSSKVALKHDYEAIPQKEFLLYIYK